VQGWIDGTYPNHGLILLATGSDGLIGFNSREAGVNLPTLDIVYDAVSLLSLESKVDPRPLYFPMILK
jgi:hypothetical protein